MKKSKLLIPVLATLMCVSAGAGFAAFQSVDASPIVVKAEDGGLVIGDNTISVTEEDIAGEGAVISMFTVETAGYYTFSSSDLVITVADESGNIIDDTVEEGICSQELAAGTYLIVFVPTSGAAGDYVATIMEGLPAAEPAVYDAGQMYAHEAGIGSNSDSEFAFYFRTDANDAVYADDWSKEYGATTVDNIKLTRNGETTSVAVIGQGTIVRVNETDHYMKFAVWTTSGVLPVQDGDVFTISGVFQCTSDETQQINITETTVTYQDGALKYSTDPVVYNAGQMYSHDNGGTANGIYFTMTANDIPYNGDWSLEYKPISSDCIKLTRGGTTTSIGITDRGTIIKYGETDYYLKLEAWTIGDYAPLQNGDIITVSGQFVERDSGGNPFSITETVITYSNELYLFNSEEVEAPTVYEGGYMFRHDGGGSGTGFHFTMAENDAPYNVDWSIEYAAMSADNIKIIRNGETTSVARVGAKALVKFDVKGYYVKFEGHTVIEGYTPLQNGDLIIVRGPFYNAASNIMINISESYVKFEGGEFKYLNPSYTFVDEDGTVLEETGVLAYGTAASAPEAPTKVSDAAYTYTFDNWYVGDEVFDPAKAYEGSVVVTAKYTATVNPYSVTVKQDGQEDKTFTFGVEAADGIVAASDVAAELAKYLPAATAEFEYAFTEEIPETFALQNYTFNVTSTLRKYTVTVRLGGNPMDTNNVYTVEKEYGVTLSLETPTAEGKVFAGWIDVDGNEVTDWTVTGDTAVYATWNVTAYTVTVKQAGKADQTFTFGVEALEGIDCTVDAVAYALSTYLPEDTDEFTYAWAEVIPETFELKDYTFTIEETAVEAPDDGTDEGDEPTEEPKEEPKGDLTEEPAIDNEGCGSVIGGVAIGAIALAGAAMLIRKKKED